MLAVDISEHVCVPCEYICVAVRFTYSTCTVCTYVCLDTCPLVVMWVHSRVNLEVYHNCRVLILLGGEEFPTGWL